MTLAYVGLGSNLGDRRATLGGAIAEMGRAPGVRVLRASSFHETLPVGGPAQPDYLNGVAEVETTLGARALLDALLAVEKRFGRARTLRWGPRTLDLDLLLFGEQVIEEEGLQVPHPRLHERAFVLAPLCELAAEARHPVLGQSMRQLLFALPVAEVVR